MKEEFKHIGHRDFSQRYQGTYGWFERENGSQLLVQLRSVDDTYLLFTDKYKMNYTARADRGNIFTFLPVMKGIYAIDETVVVVKRIPARQYKRGICQENTSITDIVNQKQLPIDFYVLEKIFSPNKENNMGEFRDSYCGNVLLDNVFSIIGEKVYLYDHTIGEYKWLERKIELQSILFKQELQDTLLRNRLEIEVC